MRQLRNSYTIKNIDTEEDDTENSDVDESKTKKAVAFLKPTPILKSKTTNKQNKNIKDQKQKKKKGKQNKK